MKKLLAITLMLLPLVASADPVEVDGLNYLLNEEEKTATVTSSNYEGILVIPESIHVGDDDYTVTAIEGNALRSNNRLISVTIPNSIKSIGNYAFYWCSNLASVKIGDGVETIGEYAFCSCSLVSVAIGNKVNTIGFYAFAGANPLTQVYISDLAAWCHIDFSDITSNPLAYAHHLYLDKKEVKDLVIPEGIEEIKNCAFYGGANIRSLVVGSGVSKINNSAFCGCSALASVTFPESLTSIGKDAFEGCDNIEELDLPDMMTTIGEGAFKNCSKLEKLKLPKNLQIIKNEAFRACPLLNSVTIPASVEFIYNYAFYSEATESMDVFVNPEYPPMAYSQTFRSGTKIYVPESSIEPYQNVSPWSNMTIATYSASGPEKCATPTVSYKNGILSFASDTPDVVFHYTITSVDSQKKAGNDIDISGNCKVTIYASKKGYEDSDTVETVVNIIGKQGDVNRDGDVNVADHVKLSDIIMNNE